MANPIRPSLKTEWPSVLLIVLSGIMAFYFYQNFPAQVPTHWNIRGEVDDYSSPFWAAFLGPLFLIPMYLLFLFLPYLDPRRERYSEFVFSYHLMKNSIVAFLFVIFLLAGLAGLGYAVDISFWIPIMVGALFIGLGAAMRKVKTNWFIGIRTPWTLSSETVWVKTHETACKVMAASGLLMAATVLFSSPALKIFLLILSVCLTAIGLPLYSYILYRQERAGK